MIRIFSLLILLSTLKCYSQVYTASYYAYNTQRITASGEKFHNEGMTAAHRTLLFGTKLKVCNITNNKCVEVRVTDRGPFPTSKDFGKYERVLDLAKGAFKQIANTRDGICKVTYEIIK